jgi:hypothetical protein
LADDTVSLNNGCPSHQLNAMSAVCVLLYVPEMDTVKTGVSVKLYVSHPSLRVSVLNLMSRNSNPLLSCNLPLALSLHYENEVLGNLGGL